MTYTPTIYSWRTSLAPLDQTFRAGGQSIAGGMTIKGVLVENPEPGGRAEMTQQFAAFVTEQQNIDASWTISRILNHSVMRVPLYAYSVQLVSPVALGGTAGNENGIPWDNGSAWDGGSFWDYDPTAPVNTAAAEGAETVLVDMSAFGEVLKIGHVIGFRFGVYDFAHTVMDITYDASDVATLTISPPLRRAITTSDEMTMRPQMMATCTNAREVAGMFSRGRHMAFNAANWVEALL